MPLEIIVGAAIGAAAMSKPVHNVVRKGWRMIVVGWKGLARASKGIIDEAHEVARPVEVPPPPNLTIVEPKPPDPPIEQIPGC
jgi:hypothetical protein